MTSLAMQQLMTETAQVLRENVKDAYGVFSGPVTVITTLPCTPLYPLSAELIQRMATTSPMVLRVCYSETDKNVRNGDKLSVGGKQYDIKGVSPWKSPDGDTYLEIVVEKAVNVA
jgi:hypothetical protein